MSDDAARPLGEHTRRSALRAGAAVAWTVPVMTVLGASAAHADTASGPGGGVVETPPPGTTPTTPPTDSGTTPTDSGTTPPVAPSETPTSGGSVAPGGTTPTSAPATTAPSAVAAPELARTGSEVAPWAVAGAGLVVGGAALYAATSRPDADPAD
ncbi:hypothetical protein [Aquipuribacter sp. SD81]|uniref:hypothetical protein n=1 Tax=Aquipuribacter sp. SD81 TaxID=3127703 RepID=UPI00301B11C6